MVLTGEPSTMTQADEELIRKFAGMRTVDSDCSPTGNIPQQAIVSRDWDLCLLARVCTDRLVFDNQFEQFMRRIWDVTPGVSFTQVDKGLYLIELSNKNEVERILNGGPWHYRHDLVAIGQCCSSEHLNKGHVTEGEVWVQFHDAPVEALTEEGIALLTGPIGVALSDPITIRATGKKFIKVKMQIPIDKPLNDKVKLNHPSLGRVIVHLVYERLGRICLFCGGLGHEMTGCGERSRLVKLKKMLEKENRPEMQDILKPTRGPWITNQMLLPGQGAQQEMGPISMNRRTQRVAGLKRPIDDIGSGQQNWEGLTTGQEEPGTVHATSVIVSDGDEEMEMTYSRRAKAARPHSPLGI